MLEKLYPLILSLLGPFVVIYFKLIPSDIANFKDILNSTISIGSIAVGFLAAAVTLLPSLGSNKLVKVLKQMGAYTKLIKYLISAIVALFLTSLLSVLGLFLVQDSMGIINRIFLGVWIYAFIFSILSSFRVIRNFTKFLVLSSNEDD
ncbi:hypothetical protein [Paenibacillus sp. Marseille-Q4541]|uniref:hypothetical protein n=1 Tax=Paenibacillus sp. Marseille-Q4541 TaxID=2831522 RepID=UPI001BA89A3F|nr:hypothetical protein [Paenibacillus sp. Marseille-Q4541]